MTLRDMEEKRAEGVHTFLIVFPTASGKSKIIEEDIKEFAAGRTDFRALILGAEHEYYPRLASEDRGFPERI